MSDVFEPVYAAMANRYTFWRDVRGFQPRSVLDVGACKGQWTDMIRRVWPHVAVTMVEADKRCAMALEPYKANAEVHMVALGNDSKKREFHIRDSEDPDTWGSSSLYMENTSIFKQNFRTVTIKPAFMDELFADKMFDLIKLDTQGSEIEILRGGPQITRCAKFIQIECSFVDYNKGSPNFANIIRHMDLYGFSAVDVMQLHGWSDGSTTQIDLLFENQDAT